MSERVRKGVEGQGTTNPGPLGQLEPLGTENGAEGAVLATITKDITSIQRRRRRGRRSTGVPQKEE